MYFSHKVTKLAPTLEWCIHLNFKRKENNTMNNLFPLTRFGAGAFNNALDFDNLIDVFLNRPARPTGNAVEYSTVPKANILRIEEGYEIALAAPGFSRGDFTVNIENRTLTVSSNREKLPEPKSDIYTSREFSYSTFSRSWSLPETVDIGSIDARYDAGILYVTVPATENHSQQVVINVK
jgi:HSP20 family protein